MKKLFIILSSTPTVADVYPLGGQSTNFKFNPGNNSGAGPQVSLGNPTFNNPAIWELDRTKLNSAASPTTGTDLLVYFTLNTVPEQGAIAERGGWNYTIVRTGGLFTYTYNTLVGGPFVVGETVTASTSNATAIIIANSVNADGVSGTLTLSTLAVGTPVNGQTITGGTSGATAVIVLYTAAQTYPETYATSLKNHPYATAADGVTPLKINADYIDLTTALNAYVNGYGHTL